MSLRSRRLRRSFVSESLESRLLFAAPQVTSSSLFWLTSPRKFAVQFDQDVSGSLANSDLSFHNVTLDQPLIPTSYLWEAAPKKATFTLGTLADGNYRAVVHADDVYSNLTGEHPTSDHISNPQITFMWSGDTDRDRDVDMNDLGTVATHLNQGTNKDWSQGDFDGDGDVDLNDYGAVATHYGTTLAVPPSGPESITVSGWSTNEILVDWVDSDETSITETGYKLLMAAEPPPNGSLNFDTSWDLGPNQGSFVVPGLQDGKKYWFKLKRKTASGDTAYTPYEHAYTVLSAPTNLWVTPASSTSTFMVWNDNSPENTEYTIQRKTDSNGTWADLITLQSPTATMLTDATAAAGTQYVYRVRAVRKVGGAVVATSAYSNEAQVTTPFVSPAFTVTNASFDQPSVTINDGQSHDAEPGWTDFLATFKTHNSNSASYTWASSSANPAPGSGTMTARLEGTGSSPYGSMIQWMGWIAAGNTITLKAAIGDPLDKSPLASYGVDLWANGVVMTPTTVSSPALQNGGFVEIVKTYQIPAGSNLNGQSLHVWLGGQSTASGQALDFDNIQLTQALTPPPVDLTVFGVADANEESLGGWVLTNSNFDELNFAADGRRRHDHEPTWDAANHTYIDKAVAGDGELRNVRLQVGQSNQTGTWMLEFPDRIRVWKDNGNGTLTQIQSGVLQPSISGPTIVNLKVEGVGLSQVIKDVELKATYTPAGGSALTDIARLSVANLNIDIDLDNNNGFDFPDGTPDERLLQEVKYHPGKFLAINDDDDNDNDKPDYADGFSGSVGTEGEQFVPMLIQLPDPIDLSVITLKFEYTEADPGNVVQTGGVWSPGASGTLRLWKKDGDEARNSASAATGGDYIDSLEPYAPAQLGITTHEKTPIWIEATAATTDLASRSITLWGDPDGAGPAGYELFEYTLVTVTTDGFAVATPAGLMTNIVNGTTGTPFT